MPYLLDQQLPVCDTTLLCLVQWDVPDIHEMHLSMSQYWGGRGTGNLEDSDRAWWTTQGFWQGPDGPHKDSDRGLRDHTRILTGAWWGHTRVLTRAWGTTQGFWQGLMGHTRVLTGAWWTTQGFWQESFATIHSEGNFIFKSALWGNFLGAIYHHNSILLTPLYLCILNSILLRNTLCHPLLPHFDWFKTPCPALRISPGNLWKWNSPDAIWN